MASMALSDVGLFSPNSSRRTPVSAARFEAVFLSLSSPVATNREDMLGIPYVYMILLGHNHVGDRQVCTVFTLNRATTIENP